MELSVLSHPIEARACPVCESTNKALLFEQRFTEMSSGSLLEGYDVAVCQECGNTFADSIPSQAAFDTYYREMSKYEYQHQGGQEGEHDLARFHDIAAIIQRYAPTPQTRFLDVGCATGGLLAELKHKGYTELLGLDPSPVCAAAAQQLYGIRVLTNTLSDVSNSEQPFDFLILVGVLEHIRDLTPALAQMRSMLSEHGLVYVEVPDATGFANWPDAPFQQFSTEHINFFSATSLTNLMRASGFTQVFREQDARPQSQSTMMPVIAAVYQKANEFKTEVTEPDTETEPALRAYIKQSQAVDDHIRHTINEVVQAGEPILIWGVGTHTQRLLATSNLAQANIHAFLDSNARYQGKEILGKPILAPTACRELPYPILVSSRVHQTVIVEQIKAELQCNNRLILLYQIEP